SLRLSHLYRYSTPSTLGSRWNLRGPCQFLCARRKETPMKTLSIVGMSAAFSLALAKGAAVEAQTAPAADASASQNPALKSPNNMTQAALAKGHNSFTKREAKARIQKAG